MSVRAPVLAGPRCSRCACAFPCVFCVFAHVCSLHAGVYVHKHAFLCFHVCICIRACVFVLVHLHPGVRTLRPAASRHRRSHACARSETPVLPPRPVLAVCVPPMDANLLFVPPCPCSIQRAAVWILENYYHDFPVYNPALLNLPKSVLSKKMSGFKVYSLGEGELPPFPWLLLSFSLLPSRCFPLRRQLPGPGSGRRAGPSGFACVCPGRRGRVGCRFPAHTSNALLQAAASRARPRDGAVPAAPGGVRSVGGGGPWVPAPPALSLPLSLQKTARITPRGSPGPSSPRLPAGATTAITSTTTRRQSTSAGCGNAAPGMGPSAGTGP